MRNISKEETSYFMLKKIITQALLAIILCTSVAKAQNGINLPYSQYGFGNSHTPYITPWSAAMGGVTATQSSNTFINPYNPASYASVGMETFLFDMGLGLNTTWLRDPNASLKDGDGALAYITGAFPVTKWWKMAIGLMPFSEVNYYSSQRSYSPLWDTMRTIYDGVGNVNKVFWGHGFRLSERLSLGANINLLLGSSTRAVTYDFNNSDSVAFIDSRRQQNSRITSVTLDLGATYRVPLGENYNLMLGLTVNTPRTMNVKENTMIYTFVTHRGTEFIRDTIFPAVGENSAYTSRYKLPSTVTLGAAIQRNDLWQVAADLMYAPWRGAKYVESNKAASTPSILGNSIVIYDHNIRANLGWQWLGDKNASHYIRRMGLSAGMHWEQGILRLKLNGQDNCINQFGVGAGVMFPMRKGRSAVRLSVDWSTMGTADILRCNTLLFGISMGSSDSWFVKRKYN